MKVLVNFLAIVSDYTNIHEAELKFNSDKMRINEVIDIIKEKYIGLKEVEKRVSIVVLLNGRKASPEDLVRDGDRIAFIPPVSGG